MVDHYKQKREILSFIDKQVHRTQKEGIEFNMLCLNVLRSTGAGDSFVQNYVDKMVASGFYIVRNGKVYFSNFVDEDEND